MPRYTVALTRKNMPGKIKTTLQAKSKKEAASLAKRLAGQHFKNLAHGRKIWTGTKWSFIPHRSYKGSPTRDYDPLRLRKSSPEYKRASGAHKARIKTITRHARSVR